MYRFYLFVTKKCNQNCLFCIRKGKNEEILKEPTIDEIKQQIDSISMRYDEIQLLSNGR